MSGNPIVEEVLKFGKASASCTASERIQIFRVVEELKSFLQADLDDLIEEHPSAPVLLQFSTDCTPIKTRQYYSHDSLAGKKRASAATRTELIVMQLFASMDTGSPTNLERLVFPDPLKLEHGKTMTALTACCQKFLSTVGAYSSPESVTIMHQIHDRGVTKRFRQAIASHHQKLALEGASSSSLVSTRHQSQLIYLDAGCALHDSHNALKWVWETLFAGNEDVLKSLHIGLACYRSAIPSAIEVLSGWLCDHLLPLPIDKCKPAEQLRSYYSALGAEASSLDLLSGDMRLWREPDSQKLHICETYMQNADAVTALSACLQSLWKFPNFCSSRWLTIGVSLRIYALGLSTGWPSIYALLRRRKNVSDYAGGYADKLGKAEANFAIVVGLVSWVPETLMSELLEDSRILRHYHQHKESIAEEVSYLEGLDASVWVNLSARTSLSPARVRDLTLRGVHVATSYMEQKIFSELTSWPWCLAIGDIQTNLIDLKAMAALDLPSPQPGRYGVC